VPEEVWIQLADCGQAGVPASFVDRYICDGIFRWVPGGDGDNTFMVDGMVIGGILRFR
jgi:hypothetical protein